ncbi:MAG: hypothetical protein IPO21_02680 [Bacteroidales bacterium]|nr:hypothetical protein [Bacteroidales bacterium]
MTLFLKRHLLSIATFLFVFTILSFIQVKLEKPMLLAERFIEHAGWIEIFVISIYAAFIVSKMKDTAKAPIWRLRIWILFSIVFFLQLILGLLGVEQCLMKGIEHLHLPIPALIVCGYIYRAEIGFMFIFFLSTILLSGRGAAICAILVQ